MLFFPEGENGCMQMEEEKCSRFFKIVPPSCIEHRCLAIPQKFIRDFGKNKLGNSAVLKVPNGKEWSLDLREDEEGKVWFYTGWDKFMQYHSINVWQFLVFHYLGNSTFEVFIFDATGSEIEYPCDNKAVEPAFSPSPAINKKRKVHFTDDENCLGIKQKLDPSVHYKEQLHEHQPDDKAQEGFDMFGSHIRRTNHGTAAATDSEKVHKERMACNRSHGSKKASKPRSEPLSRRRKEEKAIIAAGGFTSKNPFCTVYLHLSYVQKQFLSFPSAFAREHLQDVKEITLRVSDGRTWQVRISSDQQAHVKLVKGWHAFVLDNHLKQGDVCIFELVDRHQMEMKVSIFPFHQECSKPIPISAKLQTNNSSPTNKHMTSLENKRIILAATSFTSDRPFCIVTMRPSYVYGHSMCVSSAFATNHLKDGHQGITLRGQDGGTWPVHCEAERPRVLSCGWKAFALDNHLKVNDVCIFELSDAKNMELKVHIFRPA